MKLQFWYSIEKIDSLNNWVQGIAVVLGILAACLGLVSFIFSTRKGMLEKSQQILKEKKIASLDIKTKEIHDKTVKIEEKTTEIDRRTEKLNKLEGRVLSKNQINALKEEIKKFPKNNILFYRSNSRESQSLSIQFEEIFKEAGWPLDQFLPITNERKVEEFRIGYNKPELKKDLIEIARLIEKITHLKVKVSEIDGDLGKYNIIFEVGIIPANEYQSVVDKIMN